MQKLGLLALALFSVVCGSAFGAGIIECTQYANEAVDTAHEVRNLSCGFDLNHPQWSTNREAHMRWCRGAEESSVEHERNARRRSIRFCRVCRAYSNLAVNAAQENERLQCGKSGPDWSTDPGTHFNWCMGLQDYNVRDFGFSTGTYEPEVSFSREYLEPKTGDRAMEIERCKIRNTKQPLEAAAPSKPELAKPLSSVRSNRTLTMPSGPGARRYSTGNSEVLGAKRKSKSGKELRSPQTSVKRTAPCIGEHGHPCGGSRGVLRPGVLENDGGFGTQGPAATGTRASSPSVFRPTDGGLR